MSQNKLENSRITNDSELVDEASPPEIRELCTDSKLERNTRRKNTSVESPFRQDNGLSDKMQSEQKDISEDDHKKETDISEHAIKKENISKKDSELEFHEPEVPVLVEDEKVITEKKSDETPALTSDRRKQATPKKRNVGHEEHEAVIPNKLKEQVIYSENKETVPSEVCNTDDLGKVERVSEELDVQISQRNLRRVRKRASPLKFDPSPQSSASRKAGRPSNSRKKAPPPKREVTPKTAPKKKFNSRKKAKTDATSKDVVAPELNDNQRSISPDFNKIDTPVNEVISEQKQPALSLRIICTPFNHNDVKGSPEKEACEIPSVNKSSKINKALKNKRSNSPKKTSKALLEAKPKKSKASEKKVSTPAKKGRTPKLTNNVRDKKTVRLKATVKRGIKDKPSVEEHHSGLDCKSLPAKDEGSLKKTRGKRKMKKSAEHVVEFMNESEDDIEPDFSEDEYIPSKDEDPYIREKVEGKKNLKVSFSCLNEEDEDDDDVDDNIGKLKSPLKSKNSKVMKIGIKSRKSQPAAKVQTSLTESATANEKMKSKKRKKRKSSEADGDSQNESGLDMPMLSPCKGRKPKQKKRRIRIQTDKTYLDGIDSYTTGEEDIGMTTATDEEREGSVKTRKRKTRKRYGEPYSVTGNWYIAQGYLFDISNLIENFVKKDGWRFKDFASCWQELKFSLVYRGRQNFKELLEFSEEVAFLTKRFIMPPHSTKSRIGSLYALYGLYYKHPFRHFFKIRLLSDEYKHLIELIRPFQNDIENPDPAYIFRKLEVNGAIYHVASSLEMCIDFYNAEREAVDVKYESQRLANSLSVARALMPGVLHEDDEILRQYHSIKVNVAGDGKELEKSLSFVEASTTHEIAELVENLKQEARSILRLNDPPTAKVVPSTEGDGQLSSIGARRAEIMAKAVKSDTGSEYLKKKCFREPSKSSQLRGKFSKQLSLRQGLSEENASSLSNNDVQNFMKAPTKETLDKPLIPQRRSQRKVAHKFIRRPCKEEIEQVIANETIESGPLSDEREGHMGKPSVTDESVGNCNDPSSDDLEILTKVPPVLPKPKRVRGPARKRVLSLAIEVERPIDNLTGLQELKRKVSDEELYEKRRKRRQLKKVDPDEESAAEISRIQVTDLPPIEAKVEVSIGMSNDEIDEDNASSVLNLSENVKFIKQENLDRTITLNIHLKGENIDEIQHFKILYSSWVTIQNNNEKFDRLKKKLISIILPDHVKHSIDEDKVQIEITALETEGLETECLETGSDTGRISILKTDPASNGAVFSTLHDEIELNYDDYRLSDTQNITLKMEKPVLTPQKKSWSASDVIKDLQGMWGSDSTEPAVEAISEDPCVSASCITKRESLSPGVCSDECELYPHDDECELYQGSPQDIWEECEENNKNPNFHEGKSFVDLVSDVDDFEDESEPIILTPNFGIDKKGYSFNHCNIGLAENISKFSPSEAATSMFTSAQSMDSAVEVKGTVMPTPLYRVANQMTVSHSQGLLNSTSPSKRFLTYSSPLVASGGQNSTLVTLSNSLPSDPQRASLQSQPSYIHFSSESIRKPAPYNQPVVELGNSPSTASHTLPSIVSPQGVSPPVSYLGSQIPVSSQLVTAHESQHPLCSVQTPGRFPGSVTITPKRLLPESRVSGARTKSPVAHIHNSTPASGEVLRPLPDPGGMKLLKVKINNTHSMFVPASRIFTSAKKINYVSEMTVNNDSGNRMTNNELPITDLHHLTPPGNTLPPTSLVEQEYGIKSESNSSWVSNDSKSSSFSNSSSKVCSFLFSAKFSKQSGIKGTTTAEARGVPVGPKKSKVPFFFKCSLVPKKKSQ